MSANCGRVDLAHGDGGMRCIMHSNHKPRLGRLKGQMNMVNAFGRRFGMTPAAASCFHWLPLTRCGRLASFSNIARPTSYRIGSCVTERQSTAVPTPNSRLTFVLLPASVSPYIVTEALLGAAI